MQTPGLRDCISWGLLAKLGLTLLLYASHWGTGEHVLTDLESSCSVSLSSARDPALSPFHCLRHHVQDPLQCGLYPQAPEDTPGVREGEVLGNACCAASY